MLAAYDTRTNHHTNPLGLDDKSIRFSWKLESGTPMTMQTAYRIQASRNDSFGDVIWDSGRVADGNNTAVNYEGPALISRQRVYWRVKVWSGQEESDFSEAAYFEMGLLSPSDWQASWIEMERDVNVGKSNHEPVLRRGFTVRPRLSYARIYSTAHGCYSASLNGKPVTEDLFLPGLTIYPKRLQYQVYDISEKLSAGENVLSVLLGDGWWRGATGAYDHHNLFGYSLAFLCQIELYYQDGTCEFIVSDGSFKTALGPLLKSDTKCGEVYDARILPGGWDEPGFDDSAWDKAWTVEYPKDKLFCPAAAPVRMAESFSPQILTTPDGNTVLDFGQNIAGFVELRLNAPAGTKIKLSHSEVLDEHGNFTIKHYIFAERAADGRINTFQQEEYICAGTGQERFIPHFAIFGFRYVLVEDYPGPLSADMFTAHAVYCAMPETGSFSCSNPLINRLVQNSMWSQKGNFLVIPTDCPTRERSGWTGDAQLYCKTASYFMDTYTFFQKWMGDVAADQAPSGKIKNFIPTATPYHFEENLRLALINGEEDDPQLREKIRDEMESGQLHDGSVGWADAATIVPWTLYGVYGDDRIVRNQYESAKKWVDYMIRNAQNANPRLADEPWYQSGDDAKYVWDTCYHWGEWLEPSFVEEYLTIVSPILGTETDGKKLLGYFIERRKESGDPSLATAYYYYSATIMAQMAELLGNKEEHAYYLELSKRVKEVYNKYFIKDDGSVAESKTASQEVSEGVKAMVRALYGEQMFKDDGGAPKQKQAPLARALAFGLVNDERIGLVAKKLAQYVEDNGYHLNTGFLSTPFLLAALSRNGYTDAAYKLLEQTECPSWLFQVKNGATTICEKWDAYTPGKTPDLSCNHYSYGAVCDFLFSDVAGIRATSPGFREFDIRPTIGGSLSFAKAEFESPQGKIVSAWRRENGEVVYDVQVPPNSVAHVYIPGSEKLMLGSGRHELRGKY
jgi:alpha-L-rhamnosidase